MPVDDDGKQERQERMKALRIKRERLQHTIDRLSLQVVHKVGGFWLQVLNGSNDTVGETATYEDELWSKVGYWSGIYQVITAFGSFFTMFMKPNSSCSLPTVFSGLLRCMTIILNTLQWPLPSLTGITMTLPKPKNRDPKQHRISPHVQPNTPIRYHGIVAK
jgi:hypothetical protein